MMQSNRTRPCREDIIRMVADHMYSGRVLNNAHRGDVVEMMVLSALEPDWKFVSLGWHPWDLQKGKDENRIRIQVKQSAALQLWGATRSPTITFGWKPSPPSYFKRDHPDEFIEAEGWFCEIFVVGIHQGLNEQTIDQVDPFEWRFLVIPTSELAPRTNSMVLTRALEKWPLVPWHEIRSRVDRAIEALHVHGGTSGEYSEYGVSDQERQSIV